MATMDPAWKPDVIVGIDFGMTSKYSLARPRKGAEIAKVLVSHTRRHQNGHGLRLSSTGQEHPETVSQTRSIQYSHTTNETATFSRGDLRPIRITQTFASRRTSSFSWIQSIETILRTHPLSQMRNSGMSIIWQASTSASTATSPKEYPGGPTKTSNSSSVSLQHGRTQA